MPISKQPCSYIDGLTCLSWYKEIGWSNYIFLIIASTPKAEQQIETKEETKRKWKVIEVIIMNDSGHTVQPISSISQHKGFG